MPANRLGVAGALMRMACAGGGSDTVPAIVREQIADVRDAVTPDGLQLDAVAGPTRNKDAISASWTFAPKEPWPAYQAWLSPRLGARGYHRSRCDDQGCVFSQELPGDFLSVAVQASGRPIQIRVTFTACAD